MNEVQLGFNLCSLHIKQIDSIELNIPNAIPFLCLVFLSSWFFRLKVEKKDAETRDRTKDL